MMQVDMDRIYKNMPLEKIPWNSETPPEALVELVESGRVKPCKTIDLGCGAGNYAIYLAGKGFEVTGIDNSPTAIRIAQENANKKGVTGTFLVADVLGIWMRSRKPLTLRMTGSCSIISFLKKGRSMLKMCGKSSTQAGSIFLFVSMRRILSLAAQGNTEKHLWVLLYIFLLKMN
jgi:SAM-dependent methyltransferase